MPRKRIRFDQFDRTLLTYSQSSINGATRDRYTLMTGTIWLPTKYCCPSRNSSITGIPCRLVRLLGSQGRTRYPGLTQVSCIHTTQAFSGARIHSLMCSFYPLTCSFHPLTYEIHCPDLRAKHSTCREFESESDCFD